jgi:acyl-CoA thioesterase-2
VGDFEVDTRVEGRDGRYRAALCPDWEIWGPDGGYVAAIALRAAGREARPPRPATFSCQYLSVARFGAVELEVETLRRGRSSEAFRVRMAQGDRIVLEAHVRTAAVLPGLEHDVAIPPELPGPDALPSADELRAGTPPMYPFWNNLDARVVDVRRFRPDPLPDEPRWLEWYRLTPRATFADPFVDAGRALLLLDTLCWPAAWRAHPRTSFQAPNLDLAAWFHNLQPDSEWLLADHASPVAGGGLVAASGRVWSQERRLVASGGAQLLCLVRGPDGSSGRESGS